MDKSSNQDKNINYQVSINGKSFSADSNELNTEELKKMYTQVQSVLDGLLSPLSENMKNIKGNMSNLKKSFSGVNSSLKPVVEKIKEDGRLKINLNGTSIVDIEIPDQLKDKKNQKEA